MSDFTVFATLNSSIRQIQYLGGQLYASNVSGDGTTQVPLYKVSTSNAAITTVATEVPNNISIAVDPNNVVYTPTYQPFTNTGDITKTVSGVVTSLTTNYTGGISPNSFSVAYLLYDTSNNWLVAGETNSSNFYKITLADTSATYAPFGSVTSGVISSMAFSSNYSLLYINVSSEKVIYAMNKTDGSLVGTINIPSNFSASNYLIENGICFNGNYLYFAVTDTSVLTTTMYRLSMTSNITATYDTTYSEVCVASNTSTLGNVVRSIAFDESNNRYFNGTDARIFTNNSNVLCFNKGTKILYMNQQLEDEYVAIENLNIGDFVKTYKHGYRRVSKTIQGAFINNPKKWNMCMYKMAKTESNGLLEDLIVTGGHSILVDSLSDAELEKYNEMGIPHFANETIDKKHLVLSCVSDQFTPMQDNEWYQYYHLLLENNDDEEERFGIWANGVLTETPNVKCTK